MYANWPTVNRDFGTDCELMNVACRERWTWIDALFMGAPVWIHMAQATGDERYLEFGDHEFWASFDTFWDADESLLYRDRRYMSMRDEGGHKVFWSRGNGWVFAAFRANSSEASVAAWRPPEVRGPIQGHGRKAGRTAALRRTLDFVADQRSDLADARKQRLGVFHVRIGLGHQRGSAGSRDLSAGGRARLVPALVSNLYADGRLAYVQPSGSAPQIVHKESTDVYGVGAFLLAASEVYRLANSVAAAR